MSVGEHWTPEKVHALGVVTTVPEAAAVLGISRGVAYELVRRGEFPARVLEIGRRKVVVVASLLELLGLRAVIPAGHSDALAVPADGALAHPSLEVPAGGSL